jgi:CDP-diacylglycerol---serine O-phosphatidyltransferase
MRPIRTIAVFPTLLTLGNLICGFFAIVVAARIDKPEPLLNNIDIEVTQNVMLSGCLIFFAMIFDGLDGYAARLARVTSDFGAQLDSLCDVVSFGVAPGFLLVKMCPEFTLVHNRVVWIIAAAFAACAAMRLARFNVETGDEDDHVYFSGLPSPAAAAAVAGFAIMFYTLRQNPNPTKEWIDYALQRVLPVFGLLVALLMVSRVRYPHVVNRILRGQRSFAHVIAVLFSFAALMVVRGYAIPLVACAFVFYGPTLLAWRMWVQRKDCDTPWF